MPSNFKVLSGASGEPNDPNFKNVTLLLHGDGSNGAQNNTFLDSSTNNLTITRNGNTTQGSFSPYGSNWSNYFDGNGDYLTASPTALSTGDFTFECWIYSTGTGQYQYFYDTRASTNDAAGFCVIYNHASYPNKISIYSNGFIGTPSIDVPANTWTHFALVRSSGSWRTFVNGVVDIASTSVSRTLSNTALKIGAGSVLDYYFNGYISNYRVVTSAIYTAAFTPSTTPLTAITNTSLLTCQSNRFRDASTNNFTITRNGDVKVTNFAPFAPSSAYSTSTNGGSAYMDGSGDYLTAPYTTANFDWFTSGVDYTIEYWFYANSLTGISYSDAGVNHSTVIGNRDAASTTDYWSFGPTSAGTVTFYYFASGAQSVTTTASFAVNSWNHVAMTKTSSGITLFVNGVAGTTTAIVNSPISSTGTPLTIGQGNGSAFNGYVSNLRIVRGTAIYSGNFTPPTSPVTAVTNTKLLLNATNGAIFDNSMKNDLETVGNAQISTSVKKFGTGSIYIPTGSLFIPNSQDLVFGSGNWTVEFWAYTDASGTKVYCDSLDAANTTIQMEIYSSGTNLYWVKLGGSVGITANSALTASTWQHIAVTKSGSSTRLFVNGTQVGSTYTDTDSYNSARWEIGRVSGMFPLNGYLDDFRVTKGVARYTANFTPPTAAFPNK